MSTYRSPLSTFAAVFFLISTAAGLRSDVPVDITVDPFSERAPISLYIYGANQDIPNAPLTVRRLGGNRMTGYNWENNASNAGSDWYHSSDDFMTSAMGIPGSQANQPARTLTSFHDKSLADGVPYSIITLQMAGYVSKDKNGIVSAAETAPSPRWVAVVNDKNAAYSNPPDTTDSSAYMDELLDLLIKKYGKADTPNGIKGYDLDNETELWPSTHPRIHPVAVNCTEIIAKSTALAKTIKRMDPKAEVFGPVCYGTGAYLDYQSAPDWTTEKAKGNYRWFLDYYLDQMNKASATAGIRLLDVFDLHRYTDEQAGGESVSSSTNFANIDCNKGRLQAPRVLWDTTYQENSWVQQWYSSFLPYLPQFKASIAQFYPGTKLAFTEYSFGGESHISGGIAQADALGIFGKYGVYLATFWQLHDNPTYIASAFQLYRNYDGAGGKFGSTHVSASASDVVNCSTYAAIDGTDASALHLVLLNKNYDTAVSANIKIAGTTSYRSARVFGFDASSATLKEFPAVASIGGNAFTYSVPPLSALHFVLGGISQAPALLLNPVSTTIGPGANVTLSVVAGGSGPFSYQWQNNGAAIAGATAASLSLAAVSPADAATYTVVVSNSVTSVTSTPATLTVAGAPYVPPASTLINISTRARVGTGGNVMIAGFAVRGAGTKKLLLRAAGPALVPLGLSSATVLAHPQITLNAADSTVLATNDDWSSAANSAEVKAAVASAGAWDFPDGSKDAALVVALPGGNYTAIVSGADGGTGVALVEVYDLERTSAARLINISTRAYVSSDSEVMIAGFVTSGSASKTLLIRAAGPALTPFGVSGVLANPSLTLNATKGVVLSSNDDWSQATNLSELKAAFSAVGGFTLPDGSKDSGILTSVTSGAYTAIVKGSDNGQGVALVEVDEAP